MEKGVIDATVFASAESAFAKRSGFRVLDMRDSARFSADSHRHRARHRGKKLSDAAINARLSRRRCDFFLSETERAANISHDLLRTKDRDMIDLAYKNHPQHQMGRKPYPDMNAVKATLDIMGAARTGVRNLKRGAIQPDVLAPARPERLYRSVVQMIVGLLKRFKPFKPFQSFKPFRSRPMWQWLMFGAVLLIGVRTDLVAQTRPVAVVGGILIDGTGRPAVEDAVVVFSGGRIQEVGKRGEVTIPRGAQVIDAKGKTILPGLIDGHCHYWEWLGELYLAYGVTTCPDINNSPTEWIIAQKDGIQKGKIRGPRLWISGHALDGPRPQGMPEQRWQRGSIIVRTDEEARAAVRAHVEKGMDGFKVLERVSPEVAKAIADEARKLGKPVIGHSVNMWETIDAGYTSIEHTWAVMFTTIKDPKKRAEIDMNRMVGKVGTVEAHVNMVPEQFDEIIKAMIAKDIHWSPAWATQFRALSPRAAEMKKRELATLKIPNLSPICRLTIWKPWRTTSPASKR